MGNENYLKDAKYAVITGASSGIGKAFAFQLSEKGYNLVLIARSKDVLEQIKNTLTERYNNKITIITEDLTKNDAAETVAENLRKENIIPSILINNAGYGIWETFENSPLAQTQQMLQLNISALVELTHVLIPTLKKHPKSYILNVASTAAYQSMPFFGAYAASKAFVVHFSRSIAYELKSEGVSVSCLSPGSTDTNFMNAAKMTTPKIQNAAKKVSMSAEKVAAIGLKGMFRGKKEIIPGFLNQLNYSAAKILPKFLLEKTIENIYRKDQ